MHIVILISIVFLLIIQGGYYATSFLIAGMIGLIALILTKRKIKLTYEMCGLFIIALFYMLSAFINGGGIHSLSQAMLPIVGLVFYALTRCLKDGEKEKLLSGLEVVGFVSSVVGILCFLRLIHLEGGMNAGRLQFTFQYANAAGTWFGICFILMRDSKRRVIQYLSPLSLIALLCTKSVGAILVFGTLQMIWLIKILKKKKSKVLYILMSIALLFVIGIGIVFADRMSQAPYTFIERLIQSYDGLKGMLKHPFGIGPGNWQYVFPFYQSAQYDARVVHNSYVQMGVEAGIVPFMLFLALLLYIVFRFFKKQNTVDEVLAFILLHSIMEYSMFFSCIEVVLLVFLSLRERDSSKIERSEVCTGFKWIGGCVCLLVLGVLFYGTQQSKTVDIVLESGNVKEAENRFEKIPSFLKNGMAERTTRTKILYADEEYEKLLSCVEREKRTSFEMTQFEMMAKSKLQQLTINEVIEEIKKQPFNKRFIDQMSRYVSDDGFSEKDRLLYNEKIKQLNSYLYKKPACWLNNQEEYEYAKTD